MSRGAHCGGTYLRRERPCQTEDAQFAFAGGLTAAWRYERPWGNLGLVGSLVSGDCDGGTVLWDATSVYQLNTANSLLLADCYGRRKGSTHEIGTTLTVMPWHKLFFLIDYRLTALLTEPEADSEVPTVLAHTILLRAETLRSPKK